MKQRKQEYNNFSKKKKEHEIDIEPNTYVKGRGRASLSGNRVSPRAKNLRSIVKISKNHRSLSPVLGGVCLFCTWVYANSARGNDNAVRIHRFLGVSERSGNYHHDGTVTVLGRSWL